MANPLRALGVPGSEVTYEMVQRACEEEMSETEQLDWKGALPVPPGATNEDRFKLAKSLAAMANGGGGLIVYGVQEGKKNCAARIESVGDMSDGVQAKSIEQVIHGFIYPPLRVRTRHVMNATGDSHLLIIEVPESDDVPHFISPRQEGGKSEQLQAPFRRGPDTFYMREKEVEAAYRRRFEGRRQRERLLRELHSELVERHIPWDRLNAGTVVAVAQPLIPSRGSLPGKHPAHTAMAIISAAVATATRMGARERIVPMPATTLLGTISTARRGLGRHVFSGLHQADHETGPIGHPALVAVELHDDGTVGLVWRRGGHFTHPKEDNFLPIDPAEPCIGEQDMDEVAALLTALTVEVSVQLELATDYQLRVSIEPREPITVYDELQQRVGDAPVPTPGALEREIRFTSGPDTRADDIFALGHDLNSMLERSRSALSALDDLSSTDRQAPVAAAERQLTRYIFGGERKATEGDEGD